MEITQAMLQEEWWGGVLMGLSIGSQRGGEAMDMKQLKKMQARGVKLKALGAQYRETREMVLEHLAENRVAQPEPLERLRRLAFRIANLVAEVQ
jgi:hypothetical protein